MNVILYLLHQWNDANASAAGLRSNQLIELFEEAHFEIHLASSVAFPEHLEKKEGINYHHIELNNSSFDQVLEKINPIVVVYDRFMTEEQYSWRVRSLSTKIVNILDTQDLHFLRQERAKKYLAKKQHKNLKLREFASLLRSDINLILSQAEIKILANENLAIQVHYLPLFYNLTKENPSFEERKDFVFIGNGYHSPNIDAIQELKKYWPSIRKSLPDVKLNIYGAYLPESIKNLHNEKEGFLVLGYANSSKEVLANTRVLLAPLRFGAGIKGKLLEACVYQTPSVTSAIGMEGICEKQEDWTGFIADEEADFVKKAIELYKNEVLWNEASSKCQTILQSFKKDHFSRNFIDLIMKMITQKAAKPYSSIYQELFCNNWHNSNVFMSKWIEEKNKTR